MTDDTLPETLGGAALTPDAIAERQAQPVQNLYEVLHDGERVFIGPEPDARDERKRLTVSEEGSVRLQLFGGCPATFADEHEFGSDDICDDCGYSRKPQSSE